MYLLSCWVEKFIHNHKNSIGKMSTTSVGNERPEGYESNITVVALSQDDNLHQPLPGSFDEKYVGGGHGGVPVCWTTNTFESFTHTADAKTRTMNVPLIGCCGIGVIARFGLKVSPPLTCDGSVTLCKASFVVPHEEDKDFRCKVVVPIMANEALVDLSAYRSMLIAYRDCRTKPLEIAFNVSDKDWQQEGFKITLECIDKGLDPKDAPEHPMVKLLSRFLTDKKQG